MKKQVRYAFGKNIYLLGKDEEGINYWLEEPSWDCGWYWGFGYVETYTNNKNPEKARDISSHQHFDGLFMKGDKCSRDMFKDFFKETPLNDNEVWELVDYMKTFYTLKNVAELFKYGYSHQTQRAKIDTIANEEEYDLVNKKWLPEVFERIKVLLTPKEQ